MRTLFFLIAILAMLVFSAPAWASLPYYNSDVGYTIWLPKTWSEAAPSSLDRFAGAGRPWPGQDTAPDWKAGYCPSSGGPCSLLVEIKPGRKMQPADISNFNRFLLQSLARSIRNQSRLPGVPRMAFKDATYFSEKKTLRIETLVERGGRSMLSLAYVVYTRKGMLSFLGFVDPDDAQARQTIDKAVLSLYLDDAIRY
ncbi:hypothetical protein [Pseudodesulfovibrio indicus]|uniref:hypothetical protein n=1 Tax=Pseudodesulfovibrio indicus TaxID=1716143 RepID=UPI00292EC8F9|nr:hypothetical protein [Pseudodesulfovibrio indicus]